MMIDYHEIIGLIGAGLVLFGLYRTTSGVWTEKSLWYELDHFIGSVLLIYYLAYKQEYIGIFINAVYAFVVFRGLTSYAERRAFHRRKAKRHR